MKKIKIPREYIGDAWWLFIMEGVFSILFGLFILFFAGLTLKLLVLAAAMYCVVIGMLGLVHGLSGIGVRGSWWISAIFGVLVILVGLYLIRNLNISLAAMTALTGTMLVARAAFALIVAIVFSKKAELRWVWIIAGVLGIVAGIYVWSTPPYSGLAFDMALAWYMLVAGPISIWYALRVRELEHI